MPNPFHASQVRFFSLIWTSDKLQKELFYPYSDTVVTWLQLPQGRFAVPFRDDPQACLARRKLLTQAVSLRKPCFRYRPVIASQLYNAF